MIGKEIEIGEGGLRFPSGTVEIFGSLPTPTGSGDIWFVEKPKTFSLNPRGFYEDTISLDGWVKTTIKVTLSTDAGSLVNWSNWTAYLSNSNGVTAGERIIYKDVCYKSLTGVEINTPPNLDTTNWYSFKQVELLNDQVNVVVLGDDKGVEFKNQVSVLGEIVAGKDSYPVPIAYHCTLANTIGKTIINATDITSILQSDSLSAIGMFGGTNIGDYLLLGSPSVNEGAKVKYDSTGSVNPANILSEYYESDINGWKETTFMGTNSIYPYEADGWKIASHPVEQLFFGFNPLTRDQPDSWETTTFNINGVNQTYKWGRFRITSPIIEDPIVQQVKLHTDRIELEAAGLFKYGKARSPIQLFAGIENTVPNSIIDPSNEVVEYTPTFNAKYSDNEFQSNRDDGFGVVVNRRFGLDTSVPLVVAVSYYVKGTSTGNISFSFRSSQVNDGYIYNGSNISENVTMIDNVLTNSNQVRRTIKALVSINKLESNSGIVIEVARLASGDISDTLNASIVITNVVVTGYCWKI